MEVSLTTFAIIQNVDSPDWEGCLLVAAFTNKELWQEHAITATHTAILAQHNGGFTAY